MTRRAGGWGFNVVYGGYGDAVGGVIADGAGNLYGRSVPGSTIAARSRNSHPAPASGITPISTTFAARMGTVRTAQTRAPRSVGTPRAISTAPTIWAAYRAAEAPDAASRFA